MILVLLGTIKMPFVRLLDILEEAIFNGYIKDTVVVQSGYTKYSSDNLSLVPFFSREKLDKLYDEADFIVSHGGTGSILAGIKKNKKVIAVPRYKIYGEHVDDHQLELVSVFSDEGYVLPIYKNSSFGDVMVRLNSFEPKQYVSNRYDVVEYISSYIDNL